MNFPITTVITEDGYTLHGILSEPRKTSNTIVIHMHGSAGNFYQSTFYPPLVALADELNIAYLTTNSRGTGVYDIEEGTKPRGAAVEIFEDCILDIDAWVLFVKSKGYTNIILSGHSFGTNKIQYYALNGSQKQSIRALILLGFTDSYGGQLDYLSRIGKKNDDILKEADSLIEQKNPYALLSDPVINWGELPQSAISYKNFMSDGSALSRILPLVQKGELSEFKKITIPILGIVGDTNECTTIPPNEAVDLLNAANTYASCYMIESCNHSYIGKEKELISLIKPFVSKLLIALPQ